MNKNNKNQLFKIIPNKIFILKICKIYGINNINSNNKFTIKKLKHINLIKNPIFKELRKYYYNCKAKKFIDNLTYKKSITILRQLLKLIGYNVVGKERCENSIKFQEYYITKFNKNNSHTPERFKSKFIVSFE